MASDVTCLDTSGETCAESFEFYVITKSEGLDGMDGILGLSPINEAQNGPSYLSALYTQGVIEEETATFWLNWYDEAESYVTFGGMPESASIGATYKQDLDTKNDQWWTVTLGAVEYDGQSIKDSGIDYAILDTGTSFITMGQADYYNLIS